MTASVYSTRSGTFEPVELVVDHVDRPSQDALYSAHHLLVVLWNQASVTVSDIFNAEYSEKGEMVGMTLNYL